MTAAFTASPHALPFLKRTSDQRILCLWFPYLPADRVARQRWGRSWLSRERPDHPPVVFAGKADNAQPRSDGQATPRAEGERKIEIPLPSDQDVDRVMSFLERAWRRLVDMANQMQKDAAGKI